MTHFTFWEMAPRLDIKKTTDYFCRKMSDKKKGGGAAKDKDQKKVKTASDR
jgi:hypothetical protein